MQAKNMPMSLSEKHGSRGLILLTLLIPFIAMTPLVGYSIFSWRNALWFILYSLAIFFTITIRGQIYERMKRSYPSLRDRILQISSLGKDKKGNSRQVILYFIIYLLFWMISFFWYVVYWQEQFFKPNFPKY